MIAYALESNNKTVLLDDKEARKIAKNLNLNIIGTIGILLLAKKKEFETNKIFLFT